MARLVPRLAFAGVGCVELSRRQDEARRGKLIAALLYRGEMGEVEHSIRIQAKAAGDLETLAALDAAPKITSELLFYFNAFVDLDSERQHGMSLARIPRSRIMIYADEAGLPLDEAYEFASIIKQADDAHLERLSKKP